MSPCSSVELWSFDRQLYICCTFQAHHWADSHKQRMLSVYIVARRHRICNVIPIPGSQPVTSARRCLVSMTSLPLELCYVSLMVMNETRCKFQFGFSCTKRLFVWYRPTEQQWVQHLSHCLVQQWPILRILYDMSSLSILLQSLPRYSSSWWVAVALKFYMWEARNWFLVHDECSGAALPGGKGGHGPNLQNVPRWPPQFTLQRRGRCGKGKLARPSLTWVCPLPPEKIAAAVFG